MSKGKRPRLQERGEIILLREKLQKHEHRLTEYLTRLSNIIKKDYWSAIDLKHIEWIEFYEFRAELHRPEGKKNGKGL